MSAAKATCRTLHPSKIEKSLAARLMKHDDVNPFKRSTNGGYWLVRIEVKSNCC